MSDHSNHWRNMFDRSGAGQPPPRPRGPQPPHNPLGGYDDGFDPSQKEPRGHSGRAPLAPEEITDEAALALALDGRDYKPWVVQRGRSRPALMLHLRRFEQRSGLWMGWQVSYPHLIAVEYIGDRMLSLDFGVRQFMVEGEGLSELARHLQSGSVLALHEYAASIWPNGHDGAWIRSIRRLGQDRP